MQTKVQGESAFPWCTVNGNDVRNKQSAGTAGAAGRSDRSSEFACPGLEEILKGKTLWEHVVYLMQTIREFRLEVATLGRWSQQRAKDAQSREDQLESKVFQQNQSSELLDEGVHKLKNAVHQQSSFCNGMGSDCSGHV